MCPNDKAWSAFVAENSFSDLFCWSDDKTRPKTGLDMPHSQSPRLKNCVSMPKQLFRIAEIIAKLQPTNVVYTSTLAHTSPNVRLTNRNVNANSLRVENHVSQSSEFKAHIPCVDWVAWTAEARRPDNCRKKGKTALVGKEHLRFILYVSKCNVMILLGSICSCCTEACVVPTPLLWFKRNHTNTNTKFTKHEQFLFRSKDWSNSAVAGRSHSELTCWFSCCLCDLLLGQKNDRARYNWFVLSGTSSRETSVSQRG